MDTSSFIVKREDLRAHMEMERRRASVSEASEEKSPTWMNLVSTGMKWGLLPMAQEWALTSASRWVSNLFHRSKSRR